VFELLVKTLPDYGSSLVYAWRREEKRLGKEGGPVCPPFLEGC
jgi:hypothetical protein